MTQNLLSDLYDLHKDCKAASADQRRKWKEAIVLAEQLKKIIVEEVSITTCSAWQPPSVDNLVQNTLKTIVIATPLSSQVSMKNRLGHTYFGKTYRHYLKPLTRFHAMNLRLWHFLYVVYIFCFKPAYSLVRLSDFITTHKKEVYMLAQSEYVITPRPLVFPLKEQAYLVSPHDNYEFPEIRVACIQSGMVYGCTNLVLAQGCVIHHDLYDFKHDSTSEELHRRIVIHSKKQRVQWLQSDDNPIKLPLAATFVDACAFNYAHWLTEVLSRIVLFCNDPRFKKIPIIVNSDLHPNIMSSLSLVVGDDREVILLPTNRAAFVDTLYVTSVAGYVPFERRPTQLTGHSHGYFSPHAFQVLRASVQSCISQSANVCWPKKIFVRRNSEIRQLINQAQLEMHLVDRGFVIIEPEKLTFLQQVQIFSQATTVIGATGAALANIIFSPNNAKIFILIGQYHDTSYWYWQNIACASGNKIVYILGRMDSSQVASIHADFSVDIDDLLIELG